MTTGEKIKKIRKEKGMTQKQLGSALGVSYQTIAQWENNLRNPKFDTLQRISAALLVPLSSLMDQTAIDAYDKGFDIATGMHDYFDGITDALWKEYGYTGSDQELALISAFSQLNPDGQEKAVERVQELTEIPKYKKSPSEEQPGREQQSDIPY